MNIPLATRAKYRSTMGENYFLINNVLNMVILRLGDILLESDTNKFIQEVQKLDNWKEWIEAEREFRLCRSMRVALSETRTLREQFVGLQSVQAWDDLIKQMAEVLIDEQEAAERIGAVFQALSAAVKYVQQDPYRQQHLLDAIKKVVLQKISGQTRWACSSSCCWV